jgi:hypothetical protein
MPVRYPSDVELARLSTWPDEIAEEHAVTGGIVRRLVSTAKGHRGMCGDAPA